MTSAAKPSWRKAMARPFPKLYPHVHGILSPGDIVQGPYQGGRPEGVTLHYTADRNFQRTYRELVTNKLGYHFVIDRDGKVYQLAYLDRTTAHAGKAMWNGLSPNRTHLSIALISWGMLEKKEDHWCAWTGEKLPEQAVVARPSNIDGKTYAWDKATDEQEETLQMLLKWIILNGVSPKNICDHSECALPAGRKYDIGGVISTPMHDLRTKLQTILTLS